MKQDSMVIGRTQDGIPILLFRRVKDRDNDQVRQLLDSIAIPIVLVSTNTGLGVAQVEEPVDVAKGQKPVYVADHHDLYCEAGEIFNRSIPVNQEMQLQITAVLMSK
jgi:hypothetical protein